MRAETSRKRRAILRRLGTLATTDRGELPGVFDDAYVDANGTEQTAPNLECDAADLVEHELAKGSTLTVDGSAYRVRRIEKIDPVTRRVILER